MYFISRKIVWFLTNSIDPDETRQKLYDIWIFTVAESCLQRVSALPIRIPVSRVVLNCSAGALTTRALGVSIVLTGVELNQVFIHSFVLSNEAFYFYGEWRLNIDADKDF